MGNVGITIIGFAFVFFMTVLGAAVVFCFKKEIPQGVHRFLLGLAAGVMIAASVWSLLIPSMQQSSRFGNFSFVPAAVGIMLGGLFLVALDKYSPLKSKQDQDNKKAMRLFFAVTLHNIPEGLAVGFAFGAASLVGTTAAYLSALGLAIGIGVQNFPEGAAISLPMKTAIGNNKKAFLWGAASGLVEPIASTLGFFLSASIVVLQPWLLAFAAGAMLFVTVQDLLPDATTDKSAIGTWGFILGFMAMMILDVALG